MKPIRSAAKLAAILAGLALSHTASAVTTYYIDAVNGLDTNNGLTAATAVKTIVKGGVLAGPGDTVNLCGAGPYNVPANLGRNCAFDSTYSGTAGNLVTVQSDPAGSTKAVFDPGYSEFMSNPNSAWVPCTDTGAHADEYISVNTYPQTPVDQGHGSFLQANGQAGDRLLCYARIEDLRATNESFALVPWDNDNTHGRPAWGNTSMMYRWAYRGPGVYLDPVTKKMHFRGSSTHWNQPGITDYVSTPSSTVGTDPRNLSLSLCCYAHYAIDIQADYMTFKNIVIQNGGGGSGGKCAGPNTSNYNEYITFDHCFFYPTRNGFDTNLSKFTLFQHCIFDGRLPSYVCRSDVKDDFNFVDYDGVTQANDSLGRETQVCLFADGGWNEDLEVTNCEFRNGHDGIQAWGIRPRFHHNLLENLNDEAFMFYGSVASTDVRIYNNVIRKSQQAFSSSYGSWTSTGARYIYRNVIDQRYSPLGERSLPPDPLSTWRIGYDFKMNTPFPEMYCYQNTFVEQAGPGSLACAVWTNTWDAQHYSTFFTRRFMNNIFMVVQADQPFTIIPYDPTMPYLSNGNNWHRRITNATTPEFQWYNAAIPAISTTSYNTLADWLASSGYATFASNSVNWETNSRDTYPQLANVGDYVPTDGGTFFNADYRIKSTSPDRYVGAGTGGVNLTATGWPDSVAANSTPDTGALPYGSSAVAVGVDSLKVFPNSVTPIAEAGDYSIIADTDQTGFETVSFDGTGSSDPDGSISSYNWVYNGATVSTSSTFSKDLPIGTHQVFLTVTDNSGKTATDMRAVTVTDPTTFDNIVLNPGFENGSTSWTLNRGGPVVTTPTHFGAGAMSLVGQSLYTAASQEVPIVPGASTKVSCWMKTDSIPVGPKAKVQLLWLDSTHTATGTAYYPVNNIGGTTPWTYYTTTQTPPSNAVYAQLNLLLDSVSTGGYAYFDDIRLLITDNKLNNGFMEKSVFTATSATGWTITRGAPTFNADSSLSHSGNAAMRMVGVTDYHIVDQVIPVTQGQTYNVQGWMKTVGMPGTTKAYIEVWYLDSAGGSKGLQTIDSQGTTVGWTKYTHSFTIPTGTGVAQMLVRMKIDSAATGGTAYFDDFYIK